LDSQNIPLFQLHNRYILTPIKSGFLLIDQKSAHERILFEDFLKRMESKGRLSQQVLFPQTIQFSKAQAEQFAHVQDQINSLGWEIEDFGNNSYIVHSIPQEMHKERDIKKTLEEIIEDLTTDKDVDTPEQVLARTMAKQMSISRNKSLSIEEMQNLVDRLFACEHPYLSPSNKSVISTFTMEEIAQRFNIKK